MINKNYICYQNWLLSIIPNAENRVKLSTVFRNVSRPTRSVTYDELATWIWLSVVLSHRHDVCDVKLLLTRGPLLYVTRRHSANPRPHRSVTSIYGRPLGSLCGITLTLAEIKGCHFLDHLYTEVQNSGCTGDSLTSGYRGMGGVNFSFNCMRF